MLTKYIKTVLSKLRLSAVVVQWGEDGPKAAQALQDWGHSVLRALAVSRGRSPCRASR